MLRSQYFDVMTIRGQCRDDFGAEYGDGGMSIPRSGPGDFKGHAKSRSIVADQVRFMRRNASYPAAPRVAQA